MEKLPEELRLELNKLYTSIMREKEILKENLIPTSDEVMRHVTREMKKITNIKDFAKEIGDDCMTYEFGTILFHIQDQNLRDEIGELKATFRANKLYEVFSEYHDTIQEDVFSPQNTILNVAKPNAYWKKYFQKIGRNMKI
ncbi:hypothetical protein JTB14_007851 [Gonioctena quinquepunctata]|nr:hypothetical protein JTB14_007851 [Gonioctena quinquepunctata]